MALNIDTKFEGKLICASKNGMRNMENFCQSTWKSQNWDLDDILLSKVENLEVKICREVMCHENEEWCKNRRGIDLPVQNWHEGFDEFWPEHSKFLKMCTLVICFWPKYIMLELKRV